MVIFNFKRNVMWKNRIKKLIIVFVVYCILLASVMGFWEYKARKYFFKPPPTQIKIVKESKPVYKYIKVPVTNQDYKDCCESKIDIETQMQNNMMYIIARDNWKQTEKRVVLEHKTKRNWPLRFVVGGTVFTVGAIVGGIVLYKVLSRR
jgi:hypothetical protein